MKSNVERMTEDLKKVLFSNVYIALRLKRKI